MLQKNRFITFIVPVVILLLLSCACTAPINETPDAIQEVRIATPTSAAVEEVRVVTPTLLPITKKSHPSLIGKLILQRLGTNSKGEYTSSGLFELQGGWSEPRKLTDPGFDQSAITGKIIAVSADQRYIVFGPHFLLNTETGTTAPVPYTDKTSLDYGVRAAAFSPDRHYLAYTVYPNYTLMVMELISNTVGQIYQSSCAEYQLGGVRCTELGDPSWIDSNTLIFAHRQGLSFSFQLGSNDDPNTLNHITVMTKQGDVILSAESPPNDDYRAIGDVVFRYYNGEYVDAWLDKKDLSNGVYQPHSLCGSDEACDIRGRLSTVSRDGRHILSSDEFPSRMIEVRTGHTTDFGTRYVSECGRITSCLWSPDETQLACLELDFLYAGKDACKEQDKLLLIPLSKDLGGIVFTGEEHIRWGLFDWQP
jgi:hypothetical protein